MTEHQATQDRPIDPTALPDVITHYLNAHRAHDTAAALTAFTSQATVTDDGTTYNGPAAIKEWLTRSAGEYTYTIELTRAQQTDATRYTAVHHLEGNFPGGAVDLRYQFTLHEGSIERLVIEP
ncbi:nuclear transport factor 2 family protein [Kitasatospora sp. GP82]|uniref:nuclear transport factor 2 family protein n=1 Tax=Kitasatospora sp. GP82 TaxID=3035089 RepID=UPI0024760602|nr:nuclear transport factor 2 family protein [Kitasatospora sp. GP82]MDH6126056.1 ketosteroid isomerase-like protein [Kitasatospora sp. GP82]